MKKSLLCLLGLFVLFGTCQTVYAHSGEKLFPAGAIPHGPLTPHQMMGNRRMAPPMHVWGHPRATFYYSNYNNAPYYYNYGYPCNCNPCSQGYYGNNIAVGFSI